MKHLKLFQTEAEYTAYKNGDDFVLPNVSYIEDASALYYQPNNAAPDEPVEDDIFYYANGTNYMSFKYNVTTKELDGQYIELIDPQTNELKKGDSYPNNYNYFSVYPGEFEYQILDLNSNNIITNGNGQYPFTDIVSIDTFKSNMYSSAIKLSTETFNSMNNSGIIFRIHNLETNNNYDVIFKK